MGRHRLRYAVLGPRPKTYYDDRLKRLPRTWEMEHKHPHTELVGARLRELREERAWTQAETVRRVERPRGGRYSPALLSRVENGYANPPIFVHIHLAEAFDLDPGVLLGAEDRDPVSEAEMTLVRFLREANLAPHEALARLARR